MSIILVPALAGCQSTKQSTTAQKKVEQPTPLDQLAKIDVGPRKADPKRILLRDQSLVNADLRGADLRGADLSGLDLRGANFTKANLSKANLSGTQLAGAVFTQANLFRTNFQDTAMQSAVLAAYHLEDANLDGAWFDRSDLPKDIYANKRWVGNVFSRVDLSGADFSNTTLIGVTFHEADLTNASFQNAVMKGVTFSRTRVGGMDLSGARVELNGLWEGRAGMFIWVTGMSRHEVDPTVEQIQAELAGRTAKGDIIKHIPKPRQKDSTFATACANPNQMVALPPGMMLPNPC